MGSPTGKKYEAVKDLLKWNGFDEKEWTSIVLQMGITWINNIPKKDKS